MIPLLRPQLPTFDRIEPYLREIDANRWYANFGPLSQRLESRLAARVGAPVCLAANGTAALTAALLASGAYPGAHCLVPSWTFIASAAAIVGAGMIPDFVDVDRHDWMPRSAEEPVHVAALMVVGAFGMPVNPADWEKYGEPVIIDGAACFDSVKPGKSPTMVSLHATKVLGAGEGAFITSTDEAFMARFRRIINFGIDEPILGINGKMSEYHAAVALAALDGWEVRRACLHWVTQRYISLLEDLPVELVPGYGQGWVSAYCTVVVPNDARAVVARLAEHGVEARCWWRDGVSAAYPKYPHDPLPVTRDLAKRTLSLPFSHDMTFDEIETVVDALRKSL